LHDHVGRQRWIGQRCPHRPRSDGDTRGLSDTNLSNILPHSSPLRKKLVSLFIFAISITAGFLLEPSTPRLPGQEAAIQRDGLRPLGDVRNAIIAYLALIAPGHDREIVQALESNHLGSGNVLAGGLVLARLDCTAETPISRTAGGSLSRFTCFHVTAGRSAAAGTPNRDQSGWPRLKLTRDSRCSFGIFPAISGRGFAGPLADHPTRPARRSFRRSVE
jgi:hypothetical protein